MMLGTVQNSLCTVLSMHSGFCHRYNLSRGPRKRTGLQTANCSDYADGKYNEAHSHGSSAFPYVSCFRDDYNADVEVRAAQSHAHDHIVK